MSQVSELRHREGKDLSEVPMLVSGETGHQIPSLTPGTILLTTRWDVETESESYAYFEALDGRL